MRTLERRPVHLPRREREREGGREGGREGEHIFFIHNDIERERKKGKRLLEVGTKVDSRF